MSATEATPRLVVLTDRAQLRLGRCLTRTIRECVDAGLEAVVVREHDLADHDAGEPRRALLAELAALDGLRVISSRIPDPAAHALHLAADQEPVPGTVWGRSCHRPDELAVAAEQGASWAFLSPFAVTASKPGYGPPLPAEAFADRPGSAAAIRLPVYALGGVTADNAAAALRAGADGVAVMGAVMRVDVPAREVARLRAAVEGVR